jgi:hypothetical protein
MTEHDRGRFAELLLAIGETYSEPVSDARMEIYFRALSDLSLDDIRQAAHVHVKTQKFFPRPAELIEAVEGSVDDRAELAWMAVLERVRRYGFYYAGEIAWPDVATKRAAMELYGGWKPLCERLPAGGPELLGVAKQFKATYRSYAARDVRQLVDGTAAGLLHD